MIIELFRLAHSQPYDFMLVNWEKWLVTLSGLVARVYACVPHILMDIIICPNDKICYSDILAFYSMACLRSSNHGFKNGPQPFLIIVM